MQAYRVWSALCNDGALPCATEILAHPDCGFAGSTILVEIDDECTGRLTAVGPNLPNPVPDLPIPVADVPGRSLISRLTDHILEPIANRVPVGFEAEFVDETGSNISYRAIALPCAKDGTRIDTVLGVLSFKLKEQSQEDPLSPVEEGVATKSPAKSKSKSKAKKIAKPVIAPTEFGRKAERGDDPAKPEIEAMQVEGFQSGENSDHSERLEKLRGNMSTYKEKLKECIGIEGAIAVALFDLDSGMPIATEQASSASLDLEVAAAGNTNVLRAKYATMKELGIDEAIEDVLITLESQIHMIRPATSESGKGLIIYLALDKSKANLAMARRKLRQIEEGLEV